MWSRKDRLYLSERLVPATEFSGDVKEETEGLGAQRTRSAGLGATMSQGGGKEGLDRWIKGGRKKGWVDSRTAKESMQGWCFGLSPPFSLLQAPALDV